MSLNLYEQWLQRNSNPQLYEHCNHLVRKRTLNHLPKLAKWLSCVVSTYLYVVFDCVFSSCQICVLKWIYTLNAWMSRTLFLKQARYLKVKWLQCSSQLTFRCTYLDWGVPGHSGNDRVHIQFKTCMDTVHGMTYFLRKLSSEDLKV